MEPIPHVPMATLDAGVVVRGVAHINPTFLKISCAAVCFSIEYSFRDRDLARIIFFSLSSDQREGAPGELSFDLNAGERSLMICSARARPSGVLGREIMEPPVSIWSISASDQIGQAWEGIIGAISAICEGLPNEG